MPPRPASPSQPLKIPDNAFFSASQALAYAGMHLVLRHWCGLRIEGIENLSRVSQFILAPTHASHLDFWAILEGLPRALRQKTYVAAASDYFYATRLRRCFTRLLAYHNFAFDRTLRSPQEYRRLGGLLQQHRSLLIFPEGTRSRDGRVHLFKPLPAMLAVDQNVPLIPVIVQGSHAALPPGRFFPRRRPIRVVFGQPLTPTPMRPEETFHLAVRRVQQELVDKINEMWH
jgi:1-acyl-sn-glycerol-3-phosphate acyltransferase